MAEVEDINFDKITHLKRVEIQGLWGKFDIKWDLNPDVNILIGINGSGKSSVLELILQIPLGAQTDIFEKKMSRVINYDKLKLFFPAKVLFYSHQDFILSKDGSKTKAFFFDLRQDNVQLNDSPYWDQGLDKFKDLIDKVATFDTLLLEREAIQKLSNEDVKTTLDWEIWKLEKKYLAYQIDILERALSNGDDQAQEGQKNKLRFEEMMNEHFQDTNKIIGANKEREIIFKQGDTVLSPYDLSSGEKQLLIILLTVLTQDQEPSILIMDEPELSLHLKWQASLIENIRTLNPNCQIIIATHAPGIIKRGWGDKVTKMEDITFETSLEAETPVEEN